MPYRLSALFAPRSIRPADPAKASALQQRAISVLKDLGFEEAELARSWNGEGEIPLRDHRMQLLIRDAIFWRDAQQKAAAAVKRPVPPVQRQGVAQTKNAGREVRINCPSNSRTRAGRTPPALRRHLSPRAGRSLKGTIRESRVNPHALLRRSTHFGSLPVYEAATRRNQASVQHFCQSVEAIHVLRSAESRLHRHEMAAASD